MKRNFGILLGILFYSLSTSAQIVISQGNETLYIEVDGITNLKKLEGYPTPNWYSYRRENLNLDMTIRPHMTIVGGSCFPQAYHHGLLYMTTYLVTSWNVSPSLPDLSPDGPVVDSIHTHHASGTTGFSGQIDFSRHYKSQHSLKIILSVFMSDEYVPSCLTPQTSFLTFFLLPELTPGELARTAQANEAKSDQDFWKQGNCNACNKKGVPGFSVSTVTLLPGFSDQDYSYTSLGPDIDFSRYFANPGIIGMFGNGWNFVYEQELLASKKLVQYQNGTGANEMYTVLNDSISPYTYLASFSNRKRMRYYPGESRFEIFDPGTKLFSDLQLYATENDTMRFHLSHIRDMNGNLVTLTYNGQQKISAITDAAGRTTSFQYGPGDLCSRMTLPDGRLCSYQYNAARQLIRITDIYANDVGFDYEVNGYVALMRVNQNSATFTYTNSDYGGQFFTSVTNLDGNTTKYNADSLGIYTRLNRITDPSGKATIYEIDPKNGATIAKKDVATGARQQMKYNGNKMLTDFILPSGDASQTVYDSLKRIIKTLDFSGIPSTFRYDSLGNMIEYTDAGGHLWKWFYDPQCRVIEARTPTGKTETFTYYSNGLRKTHTFGSSQTYSYAYDPFGNIMSVTYPTGGIGFYKYDEFGLHCTDYTDPEGNHSTNEFDALDRITKSTHPDGSTFTTIYDCCASTGTIDENGNVTMIERTPLLQITKSTNAEGNAWNYLLDGAGRVVEKIRPDNGKYQYTYNSFGKILKETDPFNKQILLDYDLNGLLSKITDQSGNLSTFQRSKNGNVTSLTIGSSVATCNRDSLARITSVINARGQTVNYAYTADGFMQTRAFDGINDQYAYDEVSRLSSAVNAENAIAIVYNGRNAISRLTYDGSRQFDFEYDLNNELIKTKYSDNSESILRRNSRGRVTSLIIGTDSVGFIYDAASNLMSIRRSNGVNTLICRNKIYNKTALRIYTQSDTLMKWDFTRNAMGYITREARSGILCSDTVFMSADTGGFYQQGNQLTKWQNRSYNYDQGGNLIQVNPGVFTAGYDNLNRLTEWTQDGGMMKAQYFYNAQGYVAKKTVQNGASLITYHFFYNTENRVIEITQDGTTAGWKFYYDDNSLIACKKEEDLYFYHYDHQGNNVAMTDRSGHIVQTYVYDAWGKILKETGTLDQPFKYSGAWGVIHEYNYLYRMPYRFYDSFTGKFIQRDPTGFRDGVNLYKFAGNNPVNLIDPAGLENGSERPDLDEYLNRRATDPQYDADENVNDIERTGAAVDLLSYLLPGAKAGQDYAEGKPWYETFMEAGKSLPGFCKVPFKMFDYFAKLLDSKYYPKEEKNTKGYLDDYFNDMIPPSGNSELWGF